MSDNKLGPRVGSRPWTLLNLAVGQSAYFEAPPGRLQAFMSQIAGDIIRNNLKGKVVQSLIIGVQPTSREVVDLVRVTRTAE